jgi:hypothetical protein
MKNKKVLIAIMVCFVCSVYCNVSFSCNDIPVPFVVWDYSKCFDETFNFDASGSYDPDGGAIVGYSWTFGSDAYDITGQGTAHASCKFHTSGYYDHSVSLIITDNEGQTSPWSTGVFVRFAPEAYFVMVPYYVVKGGMGYMSEFLHIFPGVQYIAGQTCWCSHYTTHNHVEYNHCHTPHGYPFYWDIDGDSILETINATDTDAFFTNATYFINYTPVSGATFLYNCFGYATGMNNWILPGENGIGRVLNYDYDFLGYCWDAELACWNWGHAVKIESVYWNYVETISEKNGPSGVYRYTFPPPGNAYWGCMLVKKKP